MHRSTVVSVGVLCFFCFGTLALGQGAVQAVRGAAEGIGGQTSSASSGLTAGPKDSQEKVSPGKLDPNAASEFQTTPSGLKYRVLRKGSETKPRASDTVEVHYKGWLDDKTIFDSSYREGKTISFPLNRVIRGWTEGMQLVGTGGMIELEIPYQLGYGERGTPGGPIPAKARLHFIVELVSIK